MIFHAGMSIFKLFFNFAILSDCELSHILSILYDTCQQLSAAFFSFYNVADCALESENVQHVSVRSKKVLVCVSFSAVKTIESSLANISSKLKYTMEDSNHTFGEISKVACGVRGPTAL